MHLHFGAYDLHLWHYLKNLDQTSWKQSQAATTHDLLFKYQESEEASVKAALPLALTRYPIWGRDK